MQLQYLWIRHQLTSFEYDSPTLLKRIIEKKVTKKIKKKLKDFIKDSEVIILQQQHKGEKNVKMDKLVKAKKK